jgi:hypothetical protein
MVVNVVMKLFYFLIIVAQGVARLVFFVRYEE